jgi:ABC-type uncharacterized transport system substrate-binding protein
MKENIFIVALLAVLLGLDHSAEGQQSRVYRVGVLVVGSSDTPELKGLRDGLKDAGYLEGKNLVLDIPAKKSYEELRPVAKGYIENKFDVIAGIGGTAPLIAKELTRDIPIVFFAGVDPIASGLVKSIAHPEANVTGVVRGTGVELHGKRLEVFKDAVPALRRVTVLYNARGENPGHAESLTLLHKVAPNLGLKLIDKPIKSSDDVERALSALSRDNTDGLFVVCSGIFRNPFKRIVAVSTQKKIPLIACSAESADEQGALLYYDANRYRSGRRAAWYVDRILKGTRPQDLPVESPTHFDLVINLKTAKQIGLTIPPNVLARADKVIR